MPVGPVFGITVVVVKDKSFIVESYLDRVTRSSEISSIEANGEELSSSASLGTLCVEHEYFCRIS